MYKLKSQLGVVIDDCSPLGCKVKKKGFKITDLPQARPLMVFAVQSEVTQPNLDPQQEVNLEPMVID